jgi:hypothetical protein
MTLGMKIIAAVIYVSIALPLLPLAIAWRQILRPTSGARLTTAFVSLSLATLSYLWLLAIAVWGDVIAPHYSSLRFNTIYANLATIFFAMIVAVARRAQPTVPLALASAFLLILWLYLAAVSSVV